MKESEIRPKEIFTKYLELSKKDALKFEKSKFVALQCVACESEDIVNKIIKDGFVYQKCNRCGSLFCNPRPSQKVLNEFYRTSNSAKYWFDEFLPIV
jgi:ribosomal protein S27E